MRTLVGLLILYLLAAWFFDFWPFFYGSFRPLESSPFSLNQTAPPPSHPDHTVVGWSGKDLLKAWGRSNDLQFIPEHEYITPAKERRKR